MSSLKIRKIKEETVEEGTVEIFNMDINITQEERDRFKNNPNGFMKELIEENGFKVNGIGGDEDALVNFVGGEMKAAFQWMHFVYPKEMESNWRYVYTPEFVNE